MYLLYIINYPYFQIGVWGLDCLSDFDKPTQFRGGRSWVESASLTRSAGRFHRAAISILWAHQDKQGMIDQCPSNLN